MSGHEPTRDGQEQDPRAGLPARAALVTAWVAALFCFTVALLMAATWVQGRYHDPLEVMALERLRAQLAESPRDEALRRDIREIDWLARRAFFLTQQRLRTGAALLAGGLLVMLASFHTYVFLVRRPALPERTPGEDRSWGAARTAHRLLAAGGLLFLALLAATGLLRRPELPAVEEAAVPTLTAPAADLVTPAAVSTVPSPAVDPAVSRRQWANFRGPGGLGVALSADVPQSWNGSTGEGVLWKTALELPGYSSPVVWNDTVFVTGGDRDVRKLFCFDATHGELRWSREVPSGSSRVPDVTEDTGYAAPTPATDGLRVYAMFATGDVAAYDFEGNLVWHRHLGVPENPYGHASSLLVHGEVLYVQFDHRLEAVLIAIDAATGATRWEVERDEISWASPVLIEAAGTSQLVLMSSLSVAGYDPSSGRLLWRDECMSGEVGASPAYADGMLVAANEYATGAGLRIDPADGSAEIVWQVYEALPDVASPVATAGLVFFATGYGDMACLDLEAGEVLWIEDFPVGFYASPIAVNGVIYALDREGTMHWFAVDREYRPLGSAELGEAAVATPAFVGNRIYIRGDQHLFAIGKRQ